MVLGETAGTSRLKASRRGSPAACPGAQASVVAALVSPFVATPPASLSIPWQRHAFPSYGLCLSRLSCWARRQAEDSGAGTPSPV